MTRLDRWTHYTYWNTLLWGYLFAAIAIVYPCRPAWLGPHPRAVLVAAGAAYALSLLLFASVRGMGGMLKGMLGRC